MAEYLPVFQPGQLITLVAGEAITAGTPVKASTTADNTVLIATAGTALCIGVAARDAASGEDILIYGRGAVHLLLAEGAVTRGDLVAVGAADGSISSIDLTPSAFTIADTDIDDTPTAANVEAAIKAGVDAALAVYGSVIGVALASIADEATGRVMVF